MHAVEQFGEFGPLPSEATSSRSAGSRRRNRVGDLVDQPFGPRRTRRPGNALRSAAAAPAGRPATAGSPRRTAPVRPPPDTDLAQVAPPVDHRGFARHQRGLGDGLLGAGCGPSSAWRAAARSAPARARSACRCPSWSSRRPGPSTRPPPGQRQHPGQRQVLRRRQERVSLGLRSGGRRRADQRAEPVRAAARARPPPAPSRCRWTSGRAPRGRPARAARPTAPATRTVPVGGQRPQRRRRRRDHLGVVAAAPVSVPVIVPSAASSTGTHSLPAISRR